MAGTVAGGKAAAATNRVRYGADFYSKIGAKGGEKGRTGGFASKNLCENKECSYRRVAVQHRVAECAGSRGGAISRRGKKE